MYQMYTLIALSNHFKIYRKFKENLKIIPNIWTLSNTQNIDDKFRYKIFYRIDSKFKEL